MLHWIARHFARLLGSHFTVKFARPLPRPGDRASSRTAAARPGSDLRADDEECGSGDEAQSIRHMFLEVPDHRPNVSISLRKVIAFARRAAHSAATAIRS